MKRPLCFICLLASLVLCVISLFIKKNICSYEEFAGSYFLVAGKVGSIIRKESQYGERLDVTLKVNDLYGLKVNASLPQKPTKVLLYFDIGKEGYQKYDPLDLKIGENILVKGKIKPFSKSTNVGMFDSLIYYNSLKIAFAVKDASIEEILNGGKYDGKRNTGKSRI